MNQFGEKIKALRERKTLLQRHVATQLNIDTPMLSKIERGERHAKREQVLLLSKIFNVEADDLMSLWLADKLFDIIKNEDAGLKALAVTEIEFNKLKKKLRK